MLSARIKGLDLHHFRRKFLTNADENGQFIVTSRRTGRTRYVGSICRPRNWWGDLSTYGREGAVTGSHGDGYRGSIDEDDSLITPENGLLQDQVRRLRPGVGPLMFIDKLDAAYPTKEGGPGKGDC